MKIAISAESTVDLPQELLDKYDIKTIPFGITFKDKLESDRFGIAEEIFAFVEETKVLPKTSAINSEQYREYFESLKKEYDAVVHIALSSQMSVSNNNARICANDMENVFIVDSKNLSTGIALLCIYARKLVDEGKTAQQVADMTQAKADKVRVSFVLERLNYMYKGGRCNAVTLLGANLLKIRPEIVVKDGRMGVGKKYRGSLNKVLENYCDDVIASCSDADKNLVFITHSSPMEDSVKALSEKLKSAGFKTIYSTDAGGTVCSHCGPNCLGILFMEKD